GAAASAAMNPTPWLTLLAISSPSDCGRSFIFWAVSNGPSATFVPVRSLTTPVATGDLRLCPYNRRDAPDAPREDRSCSAQVRARRVSDRPRAVSRGTTRGARAHLLARHLGPECGAPAARAGGARPDLLPADIADELAKLQDRVPPFAAAQVTATLMRLYGKPIDAVFRSFDETPIASASVAQVHFAEL